MLVDYRTFREIVFEWITIWRKVDYEWMTKLFVLVAFLSLAYHFDVVDR